MKTEATYYVRKQYGTFRYYPANETARLICKLAGTQTISFDAERAARELGFTFREIRDPDARDLPAV